MATTVGLVRSDEGRDQTLYQLPLCPFCKRRVGPIQKKSAYPLIKPKSKSRKVKD